MSLAPLRKSPGSQTGAFPINTVPENGRVTSRSRSWLSNVAPDAPALPTCRRTDVPDAPDVPKLPTLRSQERERLVSGILRDARSRSYGRLSLARLAEATGYVLTDRQEFEKPSPFGSQISCGGFGTRISTASFAHWKL